jgi:hypothetical protein
MRDWLLLLPVYCSLALVALISKLRTTPAWFDGTLEHNHALLLASSYYNNEQSRPLQFLIPEAMVRLFAISVPEAYLLQRWLFVWLAYCFFHLYLRKWFEASSAFAGVCFLAAAMPLTDMNHLQESAPLLMVAFLAGLWAIRERKWRTFTIILVLGALDNETILCLPFLVLISNIRSWRFGGLWPALWKVSATAAPAFLVTAVVRYINRHQPHLGGAWHLPDNMNGITTQFLSSPLDYHRAVYLYPLFIFGPLWIYAFLRWERRPVFFGLSLTLVPIFIICHLLTGIVGEVRQMIPLAYIVIPAAMHWLFSEAEAPRASSPPPQSRGSC